MEVCTMKIKPTVNVQKNLAIVGRLMWRPIIAGCGAINLAYFYYAYFGGNAPLITWQSASVILAVLVAYWATQAADVSKHAEEKRSALYGAINNDDEKEYLRHMDRKINFTLEFTMFIIGTIIVATFIAAVINDMFVSLGGAFILTFVFSLAREYAWVRDNPHDGPDKLTYNSEEQQQKFYDAVEKQIENRKYINIKKKKNPGG